MSEHWAIDPHTSTLLHCHTATHCHTVIHSHTATLPHCLTATLPEGFPKQQFLNYDGKGNWPQKNKWRKNIKYYIIKGLNNKHQIIFDFLFLFAQELLQHAEFTSGGGVIFVKVSSLDILYLWYCKFIFVSLWSNICKGNLM